MREALRQAGFRASDLKKAMQRTREAMDATGRFGVDHRTRLKGAEMVFSMVPGVVVKEEGKSGGTVTVEIITLAGDGTKTAIRVMQDGGA